MSIIRIAIVAFAAQGAVLLLVRLWDMEMALMFMGGIMATVFDDLYNRKERRP
jgi:hypothetical protein